MSFYNLNKIFQIHDIWLCKNFIFLKISLHIIPLYKFTLTNWMIYFNLLFNHSNSFLCIVECIVNSLPGFIICDLKIKWCFHTCIADHLASSLLRHWTWPIVHNKPVTSSAWRRFSRFENIFLATRWNFFRAKKNTLLVESQTACGQMYRGRSKREANRLEFAKNRREFRELESCEENEARKPMPIGSSRVQSQSSFSRRFLEERIEKCCYRPRLVENFERGRWQTKSRFSSLKQT